jgi:hypothetical protein
VSETYWSVPVYLDVSRPPKVSSPLAFDVVVVGAKNTPTASSEIVPWLYRLSVTVGTDVVPETVPWVRMVGPMLHKVIVQSGKILLPFQLRK